MWQGNEGRKTEGGREEAVRCKGKGREKGEAGGREARREGRRSGERMLA